jgi:hypothetical protein
VIFDVGVRVENDILIRARHFSKSSSSKTIGKGRGSRVSMFRALVHTSFVQDNVIRLNLTQLDVNNEGSHSYPKDFFIDLIFTDARNQSNIISSRLTKVSGFKHSNFQVAPNLQINVQEEEKLLLEQSAGKNQENKDDFWINLS